MYLKNIVKAFNDLKLKIQNYITLKYEKLLNYYNNNKKNAKLKLINYLKEE